MQIYCLNMQISSARGHICETSSPFTNLSATFTYMVYVLFSLDSNKKTRAVQVSHLYFYRLRRQCGARVQCKTMTRRSLHTARRRHCRMCNLFDNNSSSKYVYEIAKCKNASARVFSRSTRVVWSCYLNYSANLAILYRLVGEGIFK